MRFFIEQQFRILSEIFFVQKEKHFCTLVKNRMKSKIREFEYFEKFEVTVAEEEAFLRISLNK